ncbi:hypothetical protein [uncultured Endozoicomonas sp.]|uniref:hypothetical protein n=1 Tax=uncultured Endozoicomonas sp. TaxID=432652 RepID=UPI002626CDE2|nr:hypothetical protein [uncultured Endozoicomonas sp.]
MEWKVLLDVAQTISPALSLLLFYFWTELKALKVKVNDQKAIIDLVDKLDKRLVILETILDEMRRR